MQFYKLSGSGNDFVLFDNRDGALAGDLSGLVQKACARRIGIGADGVLLIEHSDKADFRMRYLNADGGEADFCGNGGRCIAYLAHRLGAAGESMRFEANDGTHQASVDGTTVRLRMADPSDISLAFLLEVEGKGYAASFANTGVPHVVVQVAEVAGFDVVGVGRQIRHHERYQPQGTNANFIEMVNRHRIRIRTYERGVEDETLACGTGSTAAAVVSALRGLVEQPVECLTQGGELLTVYLKINGDKVSNVYLEGQVELVFTGEWAEI